MNENKTNSSDLYTGDIKDYRQPMITSLGILMGFILNFLASWAADATADQSAIQSNADRMIVGTLLVALLQMIVVVYRILTNLNYPNVQQRYNNTLKLYMSSICTAFFGIILALFM